MKKRVSILSVTVVIVLALSFLLVGNSFAAPPGDKTGNFDKIVFVHYPKGIPAKGGIPGPPSSGGDSGKAWYKYGGIHWTNAAIPVHYRVGSGVAADFLNGIQASFQTWEDDPDSYIDFEYDIATFLGAPSSFSGSGSMNGANEVAWVSLSASDTNAIAITVVWYNTLSGLIAEVDMGMNSDLAWSQTTLAAGTDPDSVTGDTGSYDVQTIATHEAGHWLMLGDMYNKPAAEQTMFGYGAKGELKKRSLESGDLAGLRLIYSGATIP
ncbi:MAG: hypothetical protein A2137_00665 [Chloroflexi bacterium RBG_16_58_8]|nr:MAG: hypothetical protein A2137_00665 [Chloroflexi bacterium RBG_16_58_8]